MQFTYTALTAAILGAVAVSAAPHKRAHSGHATWYRQQGTTGSCGTKHSDSDKVIAVPSSFGSSLCGKTVTVEHNGNQMQAKVADECPSCSGSSIDLSRAAFNEISSFSTGEVPISWWVNDN